MTPENLEDVARGISKMNFAGYSSYPNRYKVRVNCSSIQVRVYQIQYIVSKQTARPVSWSESPARFRRVFNRSDLKA